MSKNIPNIPTTPLLPDHKMILDAANAQRLRTRAETIERHAKMKPNIIKMKIDRSHLSKKKRQQLVNMFCQGKWCYNAFLAELNSGKKSKDIDQQPRKVPVKCGDEWEERDIDALGSLMKSGIFKRVSAQLKGLSTKKKRGEKVGALKFKSSMDSIPLRRRGEGYSFKDGANKPYNYVRFTNNVSWYRVRGGEQILELFARYGEQNCEFADAKLIDDGYGDYYLQVTVFTPYPAREPTGLVCSLDFGASDEAHITTSDGEVVTWKFLESERLKEAQRKNQSFRNWSGEREKKARSSKACKRIIHDEYARIKNAKDDAAAKFVHGLFELYDFVILQDEQLSAWHCDERYSSSVHHSIMGRILSRLKKHPRAIIIDKWAPTTKVCSCCGHVVADGLPVEVREWECPECGAVLHRDVNACDVMFLEASDVLEGYYSVCDSVPCLERLAAKRESVRVSRSDALIALADRVGDQSVI